MSALSHGKRLCHVRIEDAGPLIVTSGAIVVCDPIARKLPRSVLPLDQKIPPGAYAVDLIDHKTGDGSLPGFVRVRLSDNPVVSWRAAGFRGQVLTESQIPGYGVDAGMGCFADADGWRAFAKEAAAVNAYHLVFRALRKNRDGWCSHTSPGAKANVILFSTGGDGFFVSYWGLDRAGKAACLVTVLLGEWGDNRLEELSDGDSRARASGQRPR